MLTDKQKKIVADMILAKIQFYRLMIDMPAKHYQEVGIDLPEDVKAVQQTWIDAESELIQIATDLDIILIY